MRGDQPIVFGRLVDPSQYCPILRHPRTETFKGLAQCAHSMLKWPISGIVPYTRGTVSNACGAHKWPIPLEILPSTAISNFLVTAHAPFSGQAVCIPKYRYAACPLLSRSTSSDPRARFVDSSHNEFASKRLQFINHALESRGRGRSPTGTKHTCCFRRSHLALMLFGSFGLRRLYDRRDPGTKVKHRHRGCKHHEHHLWKRFDRFE